MMRRQYYYDNEDEHADPPLFNPVSASAPPITVWPSDYSSNYPTNPEHVPNPPQFHQHHLLYNQNYQTSLNYDHAFPANLNPDSNFVPSYSHGSSALPNHANSFESNTNYERGDQGMLDSGGLYKYNNGVGQVDSTYGGKGLMFDDYGRPINVPGGGREQHGFGAVPKAEDYEEDFKSGIQKFRVKLLSEGFDDQADMDVLCQIGLDGIRILEPETSRTLKIYPLESVTAWEVIDSYIFAFWFKRSVDLERRQIRLKSSSYTINNILDLVTAASIQSKEIGSSSNPSDQMTGTEQSVEKKKGFIDWTSLIKPANVEKDHWVPDDTVTKCTACRSDFSAFNRKHHCRNCGDIFCDKCTQGRIALTAEEHAQPVRVCDQCMAEVTQSLSNKVSPGRVSGLQSHEDLARKLQEEMDKKRKTGVKSEASGTRTMEVACPTCTVHLQVCVPASGSETIDCSVCQHPFLVKAH